MDCKINIQFQNFPQKIYCQSWYQSFKIELEIFEHSYYSWIYISCPYSSKTVLCIFPSNSLCKILLMCLISLEPIVIHSFFKIACTHFLVAIRNSTCHFRLIIQSHLYLHGFIRLFGTDRDYWKQKALEGKDAKEF